MNLTEVLSRLKVYHMLYSLLEYNSVYLLLQMHNEKFKSFYFILIKILLDQNTMKNISVQLFNIYINDSLKNV